MHIAYIAHFGGSEATTASKQPRRSKLRLQVKLVTPIYYMTKFQGIFISEKMTLWPGDDKHDPLTCVASPQVTIVSIKGIGHCNHCWVSRWILGTFSRLFLLVYSYVNSKEAIISLSVRVSVFIMPEGLTLARIKMARNVIFSRVVLLRS